VGDAGERGQLTGGEPVQRRARRCLPGVDQGVDDGAAGGDGEDGVDDLVDRADAVLSR
jgi:hypothetical protein